MGRMSRQKGSRAELEVAGIFTEAGIPMTRNHDGSAGQEMADLDNEAALYVEVRRRETLDIPGWIREVAEKKPVHRVLVAHPEGSFLRRVLGVLAFRRSREDWHVCLSLDDFIELLKEAGRGD